MNNHVEMCRICFEVPTDIGCTECDSCAELKHAIFESPVAATRILWEWSVNVGADLKRTRADWDRLSRENSLLQSPHQSP